MRLLAVILLFTLGSSLAHAQSTLTQNLSTAKLPKYSGNLGAGYNSNLYEPGTSSNNTSGSLDLTLNYRIHNANLLRAYLGGYQEFNHGHEWKTNDGFVGWVNNSFWGRTEKVVFGQQVRLNLPYSKVSRQQDTKLAGISVVPVVSATLTPTLVFIYQPNFIRNFHTYDVNRLGVNNVEYAVNQTGVLSWSFHEKWYLQGVYVHGIAWSYGGQRRPDTFQVGGELGYSLTSQFTLAGGWTNAGAVRAFENGNDQTIRIFNENTSSVYAAVYWIF